MLLNKILENVQKIKLSDKQRRYRDFFMSKLQKYGVGSPNELSKKDKKKFFNEIERDWTEDKN